MENASKALVMAAGVLLGIMLLSMIVYAFNQFSGFGLSYNEQLEQQILEEFNNKFLIYHDRTDLIAQDIVNIAYMAKEYNQKNELTSTHNNYIKVNAKNIAIISPQFKWKDFENFEVGSDELYYYTMANLNGNYKCKVELSNATGKNRVKTIIFTKI